MSQLPFCYYHEERHAKPTHCRHCGADLSNAKVWYCGGADGLCANEYWSLHSWARARDAALIRAGGKCEDCGKLAMEVHHIIQVSGGPRTGDVNKQENLRALCHECHKRSHRKAIARIIKQEELDKFKKAQMDGQLVFDELLMSTIHQ